MVDALEIAYFAPYLLSNCFACCPVLLLGAIFVGHQSTYIYTERIQETCETCGITNFRTFATSIWDETLYKAWSEIVTNLIPNIGMLETHLQSFRQICQATEVVLFERATFLVISQATTMEPGMTTGGGYVDAHRFEKISNIVKQFKLSCGKAQSQFQAMQVKNSRFHAYIDAFTANTYVMVIVATSPHNGGTGDQRCQVQPAVTLWNISNAREHFEKFIPRI
jgi:Ras-related GTP-binding protein A/B